MTHPPGLSDALPLFASDEAEPVALPAGKLPSYIADHRRGCARASRRPGAGPLPDYELLELLLFRIIPRRT
jgi:DNA repair protein RadC